MRRWAGLLLAVVCVAVLAWVIPPVRRVALSVASSARTSIEDWAGDQVKRLVNGKLRPRLEFDRARYEAPTSVVFEGVRLVDAGVPFVQTSAMRITFRDVPRSGEPLVIEGVELKEPTVLIRTLEDGRVLGFHDFLDSDGPAADEVERESAPLSASVAIRKIGVREGHVIYELSEGPPMDFDGLEFELTSEPRDEPGWYDVQTTVGSRALFELTIDGRFNVDEFLLDVARARLETEMAEDRYEFLPPQLQTVVRDHEVRGHLALDLQGQVRLNAPRRCQLGVDVSLRDASASFGEYVLPAEEITVHAELSEEDLYLQPFRYTGLGGTIVIDGHLAPWQQWEFDLAASVHGVRVEHLLRTPEGAQPKYAGRIDLDAGAKGVLMDLDNELRGSGDLTVEDGRLVNLRVVGALVQAVGGHAWGLKDRASARLELFPDRLEYKSVRLLSASVAARGEGAKYFEDGRYVFRFNAGPLERFQEAIGPLGDLFGALTDRLVTYEITGRGDDTSLAVKPLGIGAN